MNVNEPQSLQNAIEQYMNWMTYHHFSKTTLACKKSNLGLFQGWISSQGITDIKSIYFNHLAAYKTWLNQLKKADGSMMKPVTIYDRLNAVKVFFKWLVRQGQLLVNPCAELELPKFKKSLPRYLSV